MRRLRIAHVVHSLAIGGTENGVVNLVGCLHDEIHHDVICMTTAGPLADRIPPDVAVHRLGKRPGVDMVAFARLTALLRRLRVDVVHSRNWPSFDAIPAARLAGVRSVIHGEHGREAQDPHGTNRRRNALRRISAPLVDRFVTVSDDLRRWLVSAVRIDERRVTTIHNGVDVSRFTPEGRHDARRRLGVDAGQVLVGTVGRLDPVKDQAALIEALAVVHATRPEVTGVVIGEGPCRGHLEDRIAAFGLGAHVRLLGERNDVAALLPGFDVFVLPSVAEGISNTVLEAMASGVPVVATYTGGNPELIEDCQTGALVPVRDRDALARAVERYAAEPRRRAWHGAEARRRAVDCFSLGSMARRYADIYHELYASRSAPIAPVRA